MSFTDPSAEPAQPAEGQGEEASGGSPWESYLTRIPEDARDVAAEAFREMEANATKKFQEHSEFRKQWEPLKDTGIHQLPPEEVSWLVQLRQAMDDPQTMQTWWQSYAQENGLTVAEAQAEAEQTLDEFGIPDTTQQFEKLLEEKLTPLQQKLAEYEGFVQQQTQAQQMAEASKFVDEQVALIEKEHGKLDEDQKKLLATLASPYTESDWQNAIQRGWADMQRWQNMFEKNALQAKVGQPEPAESGGIPDTSPPEHKRLDSDGVKNAALEWIRNQNRA